VALSLVVALPLVALPLVALPLVALPLVALPLVALPLAAMADREAGSTGGLGVQVGLAGRCTARHRSWPPYE